MFGSSAKDIYTQAGRHMCMCRRDRTVYSHRALCDSRPDFQSRQQPLRLPLTEVGIEFYKLSPAEVFIPDITTQEHCSLYTYGARALLAARSPFHT